MNQVSVILQQTINISSSDFSPAFVLVATWDRVVPFGQVGDSNVTSFQVVLTSDGERSYVLFSYGDIEWGRRAQIGFNAGNGRFGSLALPGAGTDEAVLINTLSNVGQNGTFVFRVDGKERAK